MKRNIGFFLVCLLLLSCNKKDEKSQKNKQIDSFESALKHNNSSQTGAKSEVPNTNKVINSKWIIGEVGLNGEQPDTIIFNKHDSLLYISTDTGGEECPYFIHNDTLVFVDNSFSYDYQRKTDINERRVNKLILSGDKLCYIETIVEVANSKKTINLKSEHLCFRRLH